MSKCKCNPKTDKNLNVKVLAAFLPDDGGPKYDDSLPNFEYIPRFCHFDPAHMRKLSRIAKDLSTRSANEMIRQLSALKNTYPDSLFIDFLARVALFKHKETKFLTVPPPYQTVPSEFFDANLRYGRLEEILSRADVVEISRLDPEQQLSWFREDPLLNSHHGNWHIYYPSDEKPVFERQGELFAYMHEQMLARFDFERLALGLPRVEPFGPGFGWDKPIKYGFNPRLVGYSARPANMMIPDITDIGGRTLYSIDFVRQAHELLNGIAKGYLTDSDNNKVPLTMNRLGLSVESNTVASINYSLYGNFHNDGHFVISRVCDPLRVYDIDQGAMVAIFTAARDPIFYRWHKFVDFFFESYRKKLKPYTIKDWGVRMDVEIRNFKTIIQDKDAARLPAHLDLTNNLYSYMGQENITIYDPEPKVITNTRVKKTIPFSFKLSVENNGYKDARVVFRIFMVPETNEPIEVWRTLAVELDRFVVLVRAGESREIVRSDQDSSVILPPERTVAHIMRGEVGSKAPCGCGWPGNLLIPRGRPTGMKTKVYVLASDWTKDGVNPEDGLVGSISYCGKLGQPYPDKRPMGFPFDRTTTWGESKDNSGRLYKPSFDEAIIDGVPNAAMAEVTLTHLVDFKESNEDAEKLENKEFFKSEVIEDYTVINLSSEESSSDNDEFHANLTRPLTSVKFLYG